MTGSIEELAYTEAVRGLQEQSGVLESLQSRAGTLLAGASLVTSFFGERALEHRLDFWSGIATAAFVMASLLIIGMLWPRHRWAFVLSARALLSAAASEPDASVVFAHREAALQLEDMFDKNQGILRGLFRLFQFSSVFLIVEVVAWIVELA
jgi:endonuclease/exonuclease/phosphatase (EEP) superfamily protein YafD